jgi:hypothetical protein
VLDCCADNVTDNYHYLHLMGYVRNVKGMTTELFSAKKSRLLASLVGVMIASTVLTAAMPAYLPFSQGDTIAGPILLFPITWVVLFLFSLITTSIARVWTVLGVITLSHAAIIYFALNSMGAQ